jgi:hypothetical protein
LATGIPARLTATEGRKFGLLVGGVFLLLGALLWRRGHHTGGPISAVVGGLLLVAGIVAPMHLGPVYRAWMRLAAVISKVTTPVIMSVMYLLILTPAGLIARLVGHRPLSRSRDAMTYWHTRDPGARRGDMDHQF